MPAGELPSKFGGFIGRERELAELRHALDETRDGRGRLFLISGEPGIGKTRLAEEVAREATARGMRALWGRCWEGDGAPAYWPWIQVVRACISAVNRDQRDSILEPENAASIVETVAQIVPEIRTLAPESSTKVPKPQLDPGEARFQLFDSVATLLKSFARLGPLTIIVDDLHDADVSSLMMLQLVAREAIGAGLLIIGTYRDVEVRQSADLSKRIGELGRQARTMPLAGLSESEVGQLVELHSGQTPNDKLVASLRNTTNGNPLFVDGVLRTLLAEGATDSTALERPLKIPSAIREAIRARLDRLSPEANSLLQVAASIGNEFDFALCRSSAELPENDGRRLLEETTRAGIVIRLDRDRHRFSHALICDAVYEELDPERRIRLHGKIASTLEESYKENIDAHLAELAYHFREAGLAEKAIDYSVRAGTASASVFAYNDAVTHLQTAVELMERQDTDALRRADLLFFLGSIAFWLDRATALKYLESAGALYEKLGRFDQAGRVYVQLGIIFHMRGEPQTNAPLATDYLRRAELAIPKEPESIHLAGLYTVIAQNEFAKLNFAQAAIAAKHSMQICERLGIARNWPGLAAPAEYGQSLCMKGKLREGFALLDRTFETALHEKVWGYEAAWRSGYITILLGDPHGAQLRWERERTRLRKDASPLAFHFFSKWIDIARFDEGHLVDMEKKYSSDPKAPTFGSARRSWLGGQWEDAAEVLEREVERGDRADHQLYSLSQSLFAGLTNLLVGEHACAETLFRYGLDDTDKETKLLLEMRSRPRLAQLYAETKQPCEAAEQVARCQQIMAGGEDWRGLAGGVARARGIVEAARGNFDIALPEFEAALAIHRKYGLVWEQAETLQFWGRALAAAGDSARAAEKFDAAIEIYRSNGAAQRFVDYVMADKTGMLATKVPTRAALPESATFRKEGEFWALAYEGATFRLKAIKGLAYLAYLLGHPGESFHARDLVAIIEKPAAGTNSKEKLGVPELAVAQDLDGAAPPLDSRARAEYRRRIEELQSELNEAEQFNDNGRAARTRQELDFLESEMASRIGITGRARASGSHSERARMMVSKNIRTALEKIRGASPELGRYLTNTIRTGYFCSYEPEREHPVSWQLSAD